MKKYTQGIALVVIIIGVAVLVWWAWQSNPVFQNNTQSATPEVVTPPAEQSTNYQKKLATILSDFATAFKNQSDATERGKLASVAKAKTLTLTVSPDTSERELHLGIVLALSAMANGDVPGGVKKYTDAIRPFPWLATANIE